MNKLLELNPDFIPEVVYVKLEWKGRKERRGELREEKEQQHQEMGKGDRFAKGMESCTESKNLWS